MNDSLRACVPPTEPKLQVTADAPSEQLYLTEELTMLKNRFVVLTNQNQDKLALSSALQKIHSKLETALASADNKGIDQLTLNTLHHAFDNLEAAFKDDSKSSKLLESSANKDRYPKKYKALLEANKSLLERFEMPLSAADGSLKSYVTKLQHALVKAKCNVGAIDGLFGPKTLAALKQATGTKADTKTPDTETPKSTETKAPAAKTDSAAQDDVDTNTESSSGIPPYTITDLTIADWQKGMRHKTFLEKEGLTGDRKKAFNTAFYKQADLVHKDLLKKYDWKDINGKVVDYTMKFDGKEYKLRGHFSWHNHKGATGEKGKFKGFAARFLVE